MSIHQVILKHSGYIYVNEACAIPGVSLGGIATRISSLSHK
jgi:hypothetical protein